MPQKPWERDWGAQSEEKRAPWERDWSGTPAAAAPSKSLTPAEIAQRKQDLESKGLIDKVPDSGWKDYRKGTDVKDESVAGMDKDVLRDQATSVRKGVWEGAKAAVTGLPALGAELAAPWYDALNNPSGVLTAPARNFASIAGALKGTAEAVGKPISQTAKGAVELAFPGRGEQIFEGIKRMIPVLGAADNAVGTGPTTAAQINPGSREWTEAAEAAGQFAGAIPVGEAVGFGLKKLPGAVGAVAERLTPSVSDRRAARALVFADEMGKKPIERGGKLEGSAQLGDRLEPRLKESLQSMGRTENDLITERFSRGADRSDPVHKYELGIERPEAEANARTRQQNALEVAGERLASQPELPKEVAVGRIPGGEARPFVHDIVDTMVQNADDMRNSRIDPYRQMDISDVWDDIVATVDDQERYFPEAQKDLQTTYQKIAQDLHTKPRTVQSALDAISELNDIASKEAYNHTADQAGAVGQTRGDIFKTVADITRDKLYSHLEDAGASGLKQIGRAEADAIAGRNAAMRNWKLAEMGHQEWKEAGILKRHTPRPESITRGMLGSKSGLGSALTDIVFGWPNPLQHFNETLKKGIGPVEGHVPRPYAPPAMPPAPWAAWRMKSPAPDIPNFGGNITMPGEMPLPPTAPHELTFDQRMQVQPDVMTHPSITEIPMNPAEWNPATQPTPVPELPTPSQARAAVPPDMRSAPMQGGLPLMPPTDMTPEGLRIVPSPRPPVADPSGLSVYSTLEELAAATGQPYSTVSPTLRLPAAGETASWTMGQQFPQAVTDKSFTGAPAGMSALVPPPAAAPSPIAGKLPPPSAPAKAPPVPPASSGVSPEIMQKLQSDLRAQWAALEANKKPANAQAHAKSMLDVMKKLDLVEKWLAKQSESR